MNHGNRKRIITDFMENLISLRKIKGNLDNG
jgi:hypothetical protein